MTPLELSKKVNNAVILWAKDSEKIVIAIDGYTGVGKTTLLNNLESINPNIVAVNRDDFMLPRQIFQERLANATDKSRVFELEVCDDKKLKDFIATFKSIDTPYKINTYNGITGKINIPKTFDFSKKIMVVEGVFMFHPYLPLNNLWDKRIYLEGNIKKITERRITREKEKWGKDYFPETHPDSYFKQVCIALQRYDELYSPGKIADLILKVD